MVTKVQKFAAHPQGPGALRRSWLNIPVRADGTTAVLPEFWVNAPDEDTKFTQVGFGTVGNRFYIYRERPVGEIDGARR